MERGTLRVYLGAAPGVGKTYDMLNEGRRRAERGTDVVIGIVETHGRARTEEQVGDLEVVPPRLVPRGDERIVELDVDAVLRRRPEVALVDDLAHTNEPGSRNHARWQDIEELLRAGISVVSTVSIEHLQGLRDVTATIIGTPSVDAVPDAWVRAADQIELVDCTPEALQRRMAHGNIYPPEAVDAAIGNLFTEGNLSALRELTLLWLADRVEESLETYRARHELGDVPRTRERVVVGLSGFASGEELLRRAAVIAARAKGDLVGVHIRVAQGSASVDTEAALSLHRALLGELGGSYLEASGQDVAMALVDAARSEGATQVVIGTSRRSRWAEALSPSIAGRVVRCAGDVDVRVVSTGSRLADSGRALPAAPRRTLARHRRLAGWAMALGLPLTLTGVLAGRGVGHLPSVLLLYLLGVVMTAATGGAGPALLGSVTSALCANWYFFPPTHTWMIDDPDNVFALAVFVIVGVTVSWFVSAVASRGAEAERARAVAESLARLASATTSADPLATVAQHLLDAFALDAVSVLARDDAGGWSFEASAGAGAPTQPEDADEAVAIDPHVTLAIRGSKIAAEDRHVLHAFATHLGAALSARRLATEAAGARELARVNEIRAALLAAVSHDLRTPLASIKASVTSLLADDVTWTPQAAREFHLAIDDETDRLAKLVGNLLDMSRLNAGAVAVRNLSVGVDEIVPAALASLGDVPRAGRVEADVPETLPRVLTDPVLVERALANIIDNAIAWSPVGQAVRVDAALVGTRVHIRVIDRGPGIPPVDRDRVRLPFQRLGDRSNGAGVGLGLAVADGLVTAVGGELMIDDTPGGGTTMVVALTSAPAGLSAAS